MDRRRYEGYLAVRDAVAGQVVDPYAAEVLCDLAESLLLARDAAEAEKARDEATEALATLAGGDHISRRAAGRFWVHLKGCGPELPWPPSWDRARVAARGRALRGR